MGKKEEEMNEEEALTGEIKDLMNVEYDAEVVPEKPDEEPEEKPAETPQEDEEKAPSEDEGKPEDKSKEEEEPVAEPAEEALKPSDTLEEEPAEEADEWSPPTREEYDNLLTTMNTMAGKIGLAGPSRKTPSEPLEKEKPKETPVVIKTEEVVVDPPSLEPIEFVANEDEVYELTRDPVKFNELMNKVITEAHDRAVLLATQNVLTSIPKLVGKSIEQATTIQRAADDFYKANEDLVPFKPFVMMVMNEISAANPDKKLDELLGEVAIDARKKLNLKAKAVSNKEKEDIKNPAFVKAKGVRRTPAGKPTGLQGEIDDILA